MLAMVKKERVSHHNRRQMKQNTNNYTHYTQKINESLKLTIITSYNQHSHNMLNGRLQLH